MAKRQNIFRRGNSWVVFMRVEGKQIWRSFRELEDAKHHLAELQFQKAKGELQAPSKVTFDEAADEWLRYVEHEKRAKHSTMVDYRSAVKKHLKREFGGRPLSSITTAEVERWRGQLLANRGSHRLANKLCTMLNGIFRRARKVYGIRVNPLEDVERFPELYDAASYDFYAPEEVRALVRAGQDGKPVERGERSDEQRQLDEQDGTLFLTAAFTGLRRGELVARCAGVTLTSRVTSSESNGRTRRGSLGRPKAGVPAQCRWCPTWRRRSHGSACAIRPPGRMTRSSWAPAAASSTPARSSAAMRTRWSARRTAQAAVPRPKAHLRVARRQPGNERRGVAALDGSR
jgi:Phage integrase, N-terminal SAM-like domain